MNHEEAHLVYYFYTNYEHYMYIYIYEIHKILLRQILVLWIVQHTQI